MRGQSPASGGQCPFMRQAWSEDLGLNKTMGRGVVVEIITTVLLSYEKPNKNKPGLSGNTGEPEASASQPLFTAHSIYHSYWSWRRGCERPP